MTSVKRYNVFSFQRNQNWLNDPKGNNNIYYALWWIKGRSFTTAYGNWPLSCWIVVVRIFNATRHLRHIEAVPQRRLLCTCICTALISWIIHAHLVPLSVTKRCPVHFILNPGHVEYELGVLMVWKLSRLERDSNLRYPAWKSSALTTRPSSPHAE